MATSASVTVGAGTKKVLEMQESTSDKQNKSKETKEQSLRARIPKLFYNILALGGFFTEGSEPLEKLFKNAQRGMEIISKVEWITHASLAALSVTCKSAIDVFESVRIVGVVQLLFTPQKNNQYFLFSPENSLQKKCDRVFLFAHTVCKNLRAMNKWKLIDLGHFGRLKIGTHLTVFHLLTDGLMIASSFFSSWDTWLKVNTIVEGEYEINRKIDKWQDRPLNIARILQGDLIIHEKLQTELVDKIKQLKLEMELKYKELNVVNDLFNKPPEEREAKSNLENESDNLKNAITSLEVKLQKNQLRLHQVQTNNYKPFIKEYTEKDIIGKVSNMKKIREEEFMASSLDLVKLASSISKMFVITMALVMTILNTWSTIPSVLLLSCGIIADTFGLTKIYMEKGPKLL
jgi:hypothetical protein